MAATIMTCQEGEALLQSLRWDSVEARFEWGKRVAVGRGTYGSVFRARCVSDTPTADLLPGASADYDYAVKVVEKLPHRNLRFLAHEIAILQRVNSDHCVRLFDAFQGETQVFLVMELVTGGELFAHIRQQKCLNEADAVLYTQQLLEAVAQLHGDRIVHRDLKPENILVTETKRIKLIDFGFAKFFGPPTAAEWSGAAECPQTLTPGAALGGSHFAPLSPNDCPDSPSDLLPNTPLGSLKYLAPEILKSIDRYGVRPRLTCRSSVQKIDVFAVGVVAYVMLSGCFPFRGDKGPILSRHIEAGVKFPTPRFSSVSPEAQDFCAMLLNPNRKLRPLAREALQHPWLTSAKRHDSVLPLPSGDVDGSTFDALRTAEQEADQGLRLPRPLPPTKITLQIPLGKKLRRTSTADPAMKEPSMPDIVVSSPLVVTLPCPPSIKL